MSDCLFCKIANGAIPSNKIYEDDTILAFHDIDPKAPVHFLVIPKMHIQDVNALTTDNVSVLSAIFLSIKKIAEELELSDGYRIVTNCGEDGGQTVPHLHFHVLGKRALSWPPG